MRWLNGFLLVMALMVPTQAAYWYADDDAAAGADGRASVLTTQSGGNFVAGLSTVYSGTAADLPVVVGDHICLHTNGDTDYGWYEVLGVGGTAPAISLLLDHLAGTEHATGTYDCDSGPFNTWADIGGAAGEGGAWGDDDTAWLAAGTYNLERLQYKYSGDYGDRVIRRFGTGTVRLQNGSSTSILIYSSHADATGSLSVYDCTVARGTSTYQQPIYMQSMGVSFHFYDCIFDNESYASGAWIYAIGTTGTATRSLTCDGCAFTNMSNVTNIMSLQDMDQVLVTDCTEDDAQTTQTSEYDLFLSLAGHCNYAEVARNGTAETPITLTGYKSIFCKPTDAKNYGAIVVEDNCVTAGNLLYLARGSLVPEKRAKVAVRRNTFVRAPQVGAGYTDPYAGLFIGMDRPHDGTYSSDDYPLGQVEIVGNSLYEHADATQGAHMLEVGFGCSGALIADNEVTVHTTESGASYGMVIKGDYANILGNKCYGTRPLYVIGGKNCIVRNNSVVGTATYALSVNDQPPNDYVDGVATGGSASTVVDTADDSADDAYNGRYLMLYHPDTGLYEGQVVTDWTRTTHTFAFGGSWADAAEAGDCYVLWHRASADGTTAVLADVNNAGADSIYEGYDLTVILSPTLTESRPILVWSGTNHVFGVAPDFSEATATGDPYLVRRLATGTRAYNNILVGAASGVVGLNVEHAVRPKTLQSLSMDYNLFYNANAGAKAASLLYTDYSSLAALQSLWSGSYSSYLAGTNDSHSLSGNPLFYNVTGGSNDDWRPLPNSPARSAALNDNDLGAVPVWRGPRWWPVITGGSVIWP